MTQCRPGNRKYIILGAYKHKIIILAQHRTHIIFRRNHSKHREHKNHEHTYIHILHVML